MSAVIQRCAGLPFPPAELVATVLAVALSLPAAPGLAQSAAAGAGPPPGVTPPERLVALEAAGAAYRTGKSIFFGIRKVEVVGLSTDFEVALEPVLTGDGVYARMEIEPSSFDSGNETRDTDVAELLGGPRLLPLVFRSQTLERPALEALLGGEPLSVDGTLSLPEGVAPVRFHLSVVETGGRRFLQGVATTTFADLDIDVPGVGPAGILVSPDDELELWLRVPMTELPRPGG